MKISDRREHYRPFFKDRVIQTVINLYNFELTTYCFIQGHTIIFHNSVLTHKTKG